MHHYRVLAKDVKPFEPYCRRHTALTNLAKTGVDAFTLARIVGHSRISTTERYTHPQAEAIEQAFAKIAASQKVVTEGGHSENSLREATLTNSALTVEVSKG